ncbi:MAG TPA: alpha/beta fold hydrolase [Candidatus Eisenbacteria bacterium]|nr:alpha/beta fold hydrolase [Candidatus Eisenbacteria bacterium]
MPTAKVRDIELYYEEHGSGDPLLCIMGFATDSNGWLLQVPAFAECYRTIVFDNRGVGRSAKPSGAYTIHEMADDAAALLDHLDIDRTHVLGLSMGGMIAQELVLRHPHRVRRLVLAATFPEPDVATEEQRKVLFTRMGGTITEGGEMKIDFTAMNPMLFFQNMLPLVFSPAFIQNELPKLIQLFSGALQYGFSIEAIMGQMQAIMTHKATDRLTGIAAPTLVLTGDADRLISPANSDVLAQRIPGAKLVRLPGGTHGFNFEMPDAFNREVLGFLAGVAS